ncbi:MAG: hypothetical protein ACI828_001968 [Flavobacteriales bacterium]|jgi:hypothetical protein
MLDFEGFMQTHPLWTGDSFGLRQFKMPLTDLSTLKPDPIPENLRLGHRVEHVFAQLITHSDQYEIIAHNLQIQKEKITLGELDFILRDATSRELLHVELSYKFYILDPTLETPIQRAMGPNRKDQFFAKMEKTRDKQLPIVFTPNGRLALQKLCIEPEELLQQCCFLGQLFVPYHHEYKDFHPFPKTAVVGYWLGLSAFSMDDFASQSYYMPTKGEWLHIPHSNVKWQTHVEILAQIIELHAQERAPMVWIRTTSGSFQKCFVVWWA